MTDDLVERLRDPLRHASKDPVCKEAADEIERLRAESEAHAKASAGNYEAFRAAANERDALQADAERLDAIRRMFFERKWDGTIGRKCDWYLVGNWRHVSGRMKGDTFREAIDHAIAKEGKA